MSKQKHTPGPWRAISHPNIFNGKWAIWDNDGHGLQVASVHQRGNALNDPIDSTEANARLIAAAPELLEKGKQAIRLLEIHEAIAMSRHSEDCSCALCELKRTIAKAEGTD